jgi:hypothetical protein
MKNRKNDIWELMVRYRFWVLQRVLQHTFLHNYVVCNVGFTARALFLGDTYLFTWLKHHVKLTIGKTDAA